jgi:hypothetical protein
MKPSQCTPPPQELSKDQERDLKHPGSVDLLSTNKTKQTNYLPSYIDMLFAKI